MFKIDFNNLTTLKENDELLFKMFEKSILSRQNKKEKEPKGRAEDGQYCPKAKPGQSWAHIEKTGKEGDE